MFTEGEPPDAAPIFRYMDLARFVLLLSERKLHFTKLTALHEGDPYEGFAHAEGLERPVIDRSQLKPENLARMLYAEMSHMAAKDVNEAAQQVFVSSWCLGPESLGMWMLYGANGFGVAIKSTIGQFKAALKRGVRPEQYRFGKIRYHEDVSSMANALRDFRAGSVPASSKLWGIVLDSAFDKRIAYEYEREWRAAIYQMRRDENGIDEPIELEALVDEVHVGPKARGLETAAVKAVMTKAGLDRPVVESSLLRPRRIASPTLM